MLIYAISLVLILVSVGGILAIVARKFAQLTLIDTASLPKEREAKKKKEIIQDRIGRKLSDWGQDALRLILKPFEMLRNAFRRQYRRILALDKRLRHKTLDPAEQRQKIRDLMDRAGTFMAQGNLTEAEKCYIEVISLDRKYSLAYRGLGVLYLGNKQYVQAKETLGYLVKIMAKGGCAYAKAAQSPAPDRQRVPEAADKRCAESPAEHAEMAKDYLNLGLTLKSVDEPRQARLAFEGAVLFEPMNPKYLDLLLDACILGGNKERAWEVLERLEAVNPENQKVGSLRERVSQLPEREKANRK